MLSRIATSEDQAWGILKLLRRHDQRTTTRAWPTTRQFIIFTHHPQSIDEQKVIKNISDRSQSALPALFHRPTRPMSSPARSALLPFDTRRFLRAGVVTSATHGR